ncbi:MAG: nitric oxide reductase activation protein, partial [Actinomycetota bacterium]
MSPRAVASDDLTRYQLLASAAAERPVRVATVAEGEEPYTDGETIFLGSHADHDLHLAEVAVQASLIAGGSLERDLMRRLVARIGPCRRYLSLEGRRGLDQLAERMPGLAARTTTLRTGRRETSTAEESLRRALGRDPVGEPPSAFGSLRPHRILTALARAEERVAAADTPAPRTARLPGNDDDVEVGFDGG